MNFKTKGLPSFNQQNGDWLGIDIGTATLKLASVAKVRGEWSLRLRRLIPVSQTGRVNSETLGSGILTELLDEHRSVLSGRQNQKVACVVSSSIVELQTVELPAGQDSEIRQMLAVEFAAREDGLDREFDFFENEHSEKSKSETAHWSVLSIATKTASGLAESLWKQGMRCERLNTLPCVLAQAIQLSRKAHTETPVFALDWGATSPSLTLVVQGRPIYSRLLRNCGLQQFVEIGCEKFDCEPAQFCEMLNQASLSQGERTSQYPNTNRMFSELCAGVLEQLSQEIARTIAYVKQEYPNRVPEELCLFGGGALIPGVCDLLQNKTQLRTKLWQLPRLKKETSTPIDPLHAVFGSAITLSILGRTS